jgi:hypothetical protein
MTNCDKLVFDLSNEVDGSPSVFIKKDWLSILDNQNGSYNTNESRIDTSQLSNSNKYMNYREAYLEVPLLITSGTTANADVFKPATAGTSLDTSITLQSWYGNLIHAFSLEYNNTTIVQQTPFINMYNCFRLLTTLSYEDLQNQGAVIGFYPDDPQSWHFYQAVSVDGIGFCNNKNALAIGANVRGSFFNTKNGKGNEGLLRRQLQYIHTQDAVVGAANDNINDRLQTEQHIKSLYKSYVSHRADGGAAAQGRIAWSVMATIKLKHLHPFFQSVPLLKGAYLRMTLTLNNSSVTITQDAHANTRTMTLGEVSNPVGGVIPFVISSAAQNNGGFDRSDDNTAATFTTNVSVGKKCLNTALGNTAEGTLGDMITLNVPSYAFNPVFEQSYLSTPIKRIVYEDVYLYQLRNLSGSINQLLTNGIANLKSILIIPFHTNLSGVATTDNRLSYPSYQSPFNGAGCGCTDPLINLTNLNIVISGQNLLQDNLKYNYQTFNHHLYGAGSVNGGMTDGLVSGLISKEMFENIYGYYYFDLSRDLPVEDAVPKSVQLIGDIVSTRNVDLMCFLSYGVEISVDVLTGTRV